MSHMTEMKVRVKDWNSLHKVLFLRGLTSNKVENYRNPYSGEAVKNALVVKDKAGKVLMAVAEDGRVIVDAFYMGRDHLKILQDYSRECVVSDAGVSGGWLSTETVDPKTEDIIVEVCFA